MQPTLYIKSTTLLCDLSIFTFIKRPEIFEKLSNVIIVNGPIIKEFVKIMYCSLFIYVVENNEEFPVTLLETGRSNVFTYFTYIQYFSKVSKDKRLDYYYKDF